MHIQCVRVYNTMLIFFIIYIINTKSNQLCFILITLVLFQLHMRYIDLPTETQMQKWHTKKGTFEHGIITINLTFISTLQNKCKSELKQFKKKVITIEVAN